MKQNFSINESTPNDFSRKVARFESLCYQYPSGTIAEDPFLQELKSIESHTIDEENLFNRILTYYVLGLAYCFLKQSKLSPSLSYYSNEIVDKEIFYYRKSLQAIDIVRQEKIVALYPVSQQTEYKVLKLLGNAYDLSGCFCESAVCYKKALCISPNSPEIIGDIGYTYSQTHAYYPKEQEPFVVSWAKTALKEAMKVPPFDAGLRQIYDTIKDWKSPDLTLDIQVEWDDSSEGRYASWVNTNCLRLNRYNDISPKSKLSQEDSLYFGGLLLKKEEMGKEKELTAIFNQLKQEYVSARYMLYQYFVESGNTHFFDKNVWLMESNAYAAYSYNIEIAKAAFRALYSAFDKIALFLNSFLNLKWEDEKDYRNLTFSKVWFTQGKNPHLRDVIKNKNNASLHALYLIRNDIYNSKNPNFVQDSETRPLEIIRNYIEHRSIILNDDGGIKETDYVLYISRADFEICAMALIRRVRSAIIYLCNMVANESYDREQEIKSKGMMYGESYIGCIPDEDKV